MALIYLELPASGHENVKDYELKSSSKPKIRLIHLMQTAHSLRPDKWTAILVNYATKTNGQTAVHAGSYEVCRFMVL